MNNIIQTGLLIVVIVGLCVLGLIAYKQQQDIALLKNSFKQEGIVVHTVNSVQADEVLKAAFVAGEDKSIVGKITSIQGDVLLVVATIPDVEALKKIDTLKPFSMPRVQRTYSVRVTPQTVFSSRKFTELKVGDRVEISSSVSILSIDSFIAKEFLDTSSKKNIR